MRVEGNFEKLLQIARFEEAKLRDLGYSSSMTKGPAKKQDQKTQNQPHNSDQRRCYTCNAMGQGISHNEKEVLLQSPKDEGLLLVTPAVHLGSYQ